MSFILNILLILIGLFVLKLILIWLFFNEEIKAAKKKDPAAKNFLQILLLYQGLHVLVSHRIAHFFYKIRLFLLARLISQIARFFTGIEIHPGARIGKGFFIDHGMGVVIGETSIIGDNVTLFQGVSLGGTGKEKGKRHPTIGNNVVIGAGAKVLGNITVGDNSYIGANAVVVKDAPPNSTIVGVPGRVTKQDGQRIEAALDHSQILDPIKQALDDIQQRISKLEGK